MVPTANRNDSEYAEPVGPDLDDVVGYDDGNEFVIRDEENADAWLRCNAVRELQR